MKVGIISNFLDFDACIVIDEDLLKVSKFRKQIFLFSFETKTNEVIFLFLP